MPLSPAVRRIAAALALAVLAALLSPAAAQAQAFRFWGYYQLTDGEWGFAAEGPGATIPEDGTVEGWRLAVSEGEDVRFPRAAPTFEEICGETEAGDGQKRVGVVVDFGREADAPEGEQPPDPLAHCAVLDPDASGLDAVSAVVQDVRVDTESGLVCGLAGYPATGCGEPVTELSEEARATDEPVEIPVVSTDVVDGNDSEGPTESTDDGFLPVWAWLLLGLAVVGALLVALRAGTRRRDGELAEHHRHDPDHENPDQEHI